VFASINLYWYATLSDLEHILPIFNMCFSYMNFMKVMIKTWLNNNTRLFRTGIKWRTILSYMP